MSPTDGKPDKRLLDGFIDNLTPPNDEMDVISATIVLERAGIDLNTLSEDLKERLEREVGSLAGDYRSGVRFLITGRGDD